MPRPGRGTFVAAPPGARRRARPRLAGGRARRPAAPDDGGAGRAAGARRREGTLALSSGYLDPRLQPTAALARGAGPRRPPPGRVGARPGRGRRGAAGVVRARGRRALRRPRRRHLPRRPGRARRPPCARSRRPAARCVVESPTYRGALAAVRAAGLTPVPVPSDADGVRPEMLADALERTGARVVYLQPLHANPHGADLSAERRAEVMEVAARCGRLPDRGRLGARPDHRRPGAAAAGGRRPPTATSSTCAR